MYKILWNDKYVGNAFVKKEGLYYRISCSCDLPKKGIFRISASDGLNTHNLGICVPDGDSYSCVTRIPCKRFCGNNLLFVIINGDKKVSVPIMDGKPFAYLDKLNTASLRYENGQAEIVIDPNQDLQGNGRNREYQNK